MKVENTKSLGGLNQSIFKADLNIIHTASWMLKAKIEILKPFALSFQQFNILKILSKDNFNSSSIKSLTEQMFDRMSNTSRLVEKLEKKKFIKRKVNKLDRRVVEISLTKLGMKKYLAADHLLVQAIIKTYSILSKKEILQLNNLHNKLDTNS